ncbi:hypothetical protein DITRI_Ditri01bG0190900 [Diplodiscus trichospermus]
MKQKIVIKVSMHCSKCRKKALKIAAKADEVISVALHGPEKDRLMIVGDEVDIANLTRSLKKKLCHAKIETVEEVKETKKEEPKPTPAPNPVVIHCSQQPQVEYYRVVADPPPIYCTIM